METIFKFRPRMSHTSNPLFSKQNSFNPAMLHNRIENLFAQAVQNAVGFDHAPTHIGVNITETDVAYVLHLAVPGYQKEQFSLKTEPKHLIVQAKSLTALTAETQKTAAEGGAEGNISEVAVPKASTKWLRHEFSNEPFERKFTLPENVQVADIAARYENGILFVTLPKRAADSSLHREISIV